MAGKRQKPAEQLQGYGSAHRGEPALHLVSPDDRREVPAPPSGMDAALLTAWEAFWGDQVSTLIKPADHFDLARYFVLLSKREKHERAIDRQPTVLGSTGNRVINPRLALVKELTREIEKLREHLGILPLSRLRLNITEDAKTVSGIAALRAQLDRGEKATERDNGAIEAEVVVLDELG